MTPSSTSRQPIRIASNRSVAESIVLLYDQVLAEPGAHRSTLIARVAQLVKRDRQQLLDAIVGDVFSL